jgi:hypothetical protein
MYLLKNGPVAANDPGFWAFMARINGPFRRFGGTPLVKAEAIMGKYGMHRINDVAFALGHGPGFMESNLHLFRVPYTDEELRWGSQNNCVLTPLTLGIEALQVLVNKTGGRVNLPKEMENRYEKDEDQVVWRLVLRPSAASRENESLRHQPRSMRKKNRLHILDLRLALSAAYLDFRIHGLAPRGNRLTASIIRKPSGAVEKRILVGEGAGMTPGVCAVAAQEYAEYPAAVGWMPRQMTGEKPKSRNA